ncbi:RES family NAD+ phosphorylase [Marinicellulosiphila megalodicopiae]|uniref:RES family NAD+ phosphorylase n=1 Tax=Marinicellulosiphila megalodicopiae TaxID=2724896 RepID=UPI003BB0325D
MKIEEEKLYICIECIKNPYLINKLKSKKGIYNCAICENDGKGIALNELVSKIEGVFSESYQLTPENPEGHEYYLQKIGEWYRKGDEADFIISELLGVDEDSELTNMILEHFDLSMFNMYEDQNDEFMFEQKKIVDHNYKFSWNKYINSIENESRFFNKFALEILDDLFNNIQNYKNESNNSIIRIIDKSTPIYRARSKFNFKDIVDIIEDLPNSLGIPKNTGLGRMNFSGIRAFYGSLDPSTCINEIRPDVDSYTIMGEFKLLRKLTIIDLSDLSEFYINDSMFDPDYVKNQQKAKFLEYLIKEISKPIEKNKEEKEYLPTQVLSEYLCNHANLKLDGIIFNSSRDKDSNKNIVIFNRSCEIRNDFKYSIIERYDYDFPNDIHISKKKRDINPVNNEIIDMDTFTEDSLELENVIISEIESVSYKEKRHSVKEEE